MPAAPPAADVLAQARDLETLLLQAIYRRDKATMASLMSPDGFGFDATMGLVSQTELIAAIDALEDGAGFEIDEVTAVAAGPDVVALAYRLRQWGTFAGVALPPVAYCSSMWRRCGGRWQAVFHHETPCAAG